MTILGFASSSDDPNENGDTFSKAALASMKKMGLRPEDLPPRGELQARGADFSEHRNLVLRVFIGAGFFMLVLFTFIFIELLGMHTV